jgi:ATP-dependent Clp protease ATP-binding subunit ClpA
MALNQNMAPVQLEKLWRKNLENPLSDKILSGEIKAGNTV